MVLLDQIVHILALPEATLFRQQLSLFHTASGTNIGWMLVDVDDPGGGQIGSRRPYFTKEFGCRSPGASLTEVEIQCLACRVQSAIQIHLLPFDLHIGFINAPRIIRLLQIRSATFIQFRRILLNPKINSCVIDR